MVEQGAYGVNFSTRFTFNVNLKKCKKLAIGRAMRYSQGKILS